MEDKDLVYGLLVGALTFMAESRAKYCAAIFTALMSAKTWGEFKNMVPREVYDKYTSLSFYYKGPKGEQPEDIEKYYFPDDRRFNPNDVYTYDYIEAQPAFPAIEMSEWVPQDIQDKYGKLSHYYMCNGNFPDGDELKLDVNHMDEIVSAMQAHGYNCRRDDNLIESVIGMTFNPDDYMEDDEEEEI